MLSLKHQNILIMSLFASLIFLLSIEVNGDHLSREQCYTYFECVLGKNSALNQCYDNDYLNKMDLTRVMCLRMAQHNCKVETGIAGTGRKMTISRPLDIYNRPTILDHEAGDVATGNHNIRIYNYAGWNHCPPQYQGLQDYWCDPHQLRYPPRPWCDVLPTYNVQRPKVYEHYQKEKTKNVENRLFYSKD